MASNFSESGSTTDDSMNLSVKVWMRACPWHQLPIQQSQIKVAPDRGVKNSTTSAREFTYQLRIKERRPRDHSQEGGKG